MNEIPVIKNVVRTSTSPRQRVQEGRPFPLGATWDGLGVNFALFSANATKVELCLFDAEGKVELKSRADGSRELMTPADAIARLTV